MLLVELPENKCSHLTCFQRLNDRVHELHSAKGDLERVVVLPKFPDIVKSRKKRDLSALDVFQSMRGVQQQSQGRFNVGAMRAESAEMFRNLSDSEKKRYQDVADAMNTTRHTDNVGQPEQDSELSAIL